jgi:hypothetical protein
MPTYFLGVTTPRASVQIGSQGYEDSTETSTNKCHWSVLGYPKLLSKDYSVLSELDFVACSGAVCYTARGSQAKRGGL